MTSKRNKSRLPDTVVPVDLQQVAMVLGVTITEHGEITSEQCRAVSEAMRARMPPMPKD